MSYAWQQFSCAVKALNRPCDERTRLANAYSKLVKLRTRDLPAELVDDFNLLVGSISRFPARNLSCEIKSLVSSLDDAQLAAANSRISMMHEVLERYQPRSGRTPAFRAPAIGLPRMQSGIATALA